MVVSEPVLLVVGAGALAFTLAVSRILSAEAKRRLDLHRVHSQAIALRNHYARHVLAIHSQPTPRAPAGAGPDAAAMTVPPEPGEVRARAAA